MMRVINLVLNIIAANSMAWAEMTHREYCSDFERRSGVLNCSCPDEPVPRQSFSGTRCTSNHKTGDRRCCSYLNDVLQNCWTN